MRKKIIYIGEDFEDKKLGLESQGWQMEGAPRSVNYIQYAVFVENPHLTIQTPTTKILPNNDIEISQI